MPAHAARRSEAMGISQYAVPATPMFAGKPNRKVSRGLTVLAAHRRPLGTRDREPHEVVRTTQNVLSLLRQKLPERASIDTYPTIVPVLTTKFPSAEGYAHRETSTSTQRSPSFAQPHPRSVKSARMCVSLPSATGIKARRSPRYLTNHPPSLRLSLFFPFRKPPSFFFCPSLLFSTSLYDGRGP